MFLSRLSILLLSLLAFIYEAKAASLPEDQSKAVILAYHRIGEDAHPESSLRIEQFQVHLKELQAGEYTVLPLPEIIEAFKNNTPLPRKTLAITFEGAHSSAYKHAMQPLLAAQIPFTVFYAADKANQNITSYMSWAQLQSLEKLELVTLATLPAQYQHTAHLDHQDILKTINKARQSHREKLNQEARFLSYPFGEYAQNLKSIAQSQGYSAAFTLNSGAAHSSKNLYTLPRFSMTENYGSLERFRLITSTLPLPVTDFEPQDSIITSDTLVIGFTIPKALQNTVSCFFSDGLKHSHERIGQRVELRASLSELSDRRVRLNCTIDESKNTQDATWRWFGKLFHLPPNETPNQEPDALP